MIKHSWSEQLFFAINRHVTEHPILSVLMPAIATYGIYILFLFTLLVGAYPWNWDTRHVVLFVFELGVVGVSAIAISWIIGWLWPHRRPVREHPFRVRQLVKPVSTWKSFPSDHTTASFVMAFFLYIEHVQSWAIAVALCIAALIAVSRVFVGVHYPRDIVGGVVLATSVVWLYSFL